MVANNITSPTQFPRTLNIFHAPRTLPKTDTMERGQTLNNFLVKYFDWAFCFGISPFRFIKESKNSFRIHKTYPQMIISAVLLIFSSIYSCSIVRLSLDSGLHKDLKDPTIYFYYSSIILRLLYALQFIVPLWLNNFKFLTLVNFIESRMFFFKSKRSYLQSKKLFHFICFLHVFMAVIEPLLKLTVPINYNMWNLGTISNSRYAYFIANITESHKNVKYEDVSYLDYFVTVLYVLGMVNR